MALTKAWKNCRWCWLTVLKNYEKSLIFIKSFLAIFVIFWAILKMISGNTFWPLWKLRNKTVLCDFGTTVTYWCFQLIPTRMRLLFPVFASQQCQVGLPPAAAKLCLAYSSPTPLTSTALGFCSPCNILHFSYFPVTYHLRPRISVRLHFYRKRKNSNFSVARNIN